MKYVVNVGWVDKSFQHESQTCIIELALFLIKKNLSLIFPEFTQPTLLWREHMRIFEQAAANSKATFFPSRMLPK